MKLLEKILAHIFSIFLTLINILVYLCVFIIGYLFKISEKVKKSQIYTFKILIPIIILVEFGIIKLIPLLIATKNPLIQFIAIVGGLSLVVTIPLLYICSFVFLMWIADRSRKNYMAGNYSNKNISIWFFFDRRIFSRSVLESRMAHIILAFSGYKYDEVDLLG